MTTPGEKSRPSAKRIAKAQTVKAAEAPFELANLYPRDTGLPMTEWVSPRGRARHDARVRVRGSRGDDINPTDLAVVAIQPIPRVVRGPLAQSDFVPVAEWITLNEDALIGYWNGILSTVELVTRLRRLGGAPAP